MAWITLILLVILEIGFKTKFVRKQTMDLLFVRTQTKAVLFVRTQTMAFCIVCEDTNNGTYYIYKFKSFHQLHFYHY